VLIWNWRHGFPTSQFLVHRGALDERAHIRPLEVFSFLAQQAGVISPLLFFGLIIALCWPRFARTAKIETGYLVSLFLPLFLLYLFLSFQKASQANWAAAAYVGGLILVAAKWTEALRTRPHLRWLVIAGVGVALLETGILHETSWLHLPGGLDPLDRARGSRDLAAQIDELQRKTGARFVIANKYMTAALLSFYLPDQPDTFMPVSSPPFNQIVLWPTYRTKHPADNAIFITDSNRVPTSVTEDFPGIEPVGEIHTSEAGRSVGRFDVFFCRRSPSDDTLNSSK
jgi:hypothetical protein